MPTPSALDIIAAGIQDIATALNHPGPNSPLNPLTTQQAAALRDIVTIFNGVLPVDDNKDTPSRLRVETKKERELQPASTPTLPTPTLPTSDPTPPNPPPTTTIPPPPTPPITYADAVRRKSRCKAMPKPTMPAIIAPAPPSNTRRRSQRRRMKRVIQSNVAEKIAKHYIFLDYPDPDV
jgi:hypothetical protein